MANLENDLKDLQRHSAIQDARITSLETKFEMFMQSLKESNERRDAELLDFKNETREQNKMRADEIAEIRNDIKEIHKTTDAKLAALSAATDTKVGKIENKIDSMVKHIQILSITAMGGIIAAGVGIAAMIWSVMNK